MSCNMVPVKLYLMFFIFISSGIIKESVCKGSRNRRHTVYWNTFMTPGLSDGSHTRFVKVNEFMDILCPHQNLAGITSGYHQPIFDIYNVTEDEYGRCQHGGKKNLIFSCNKPHRENKLTIKFQLWSPSPFGFRFRYCEDYFLLAKARSSDDDNQTASCDDGNSTRLKISVRCKKKMTRSAGILHRRSRKNKRRSRRKRRRSNATPAPLQDALLMPTTSKLNIPQESSLHEHASIGNIAAVADQSERKKQVVELKIKANPAARRERTLEPRGNTFLGFLLSKLPGKFMRLMKLST